MAKIITAAEANEKVDKVIDDWISEKFKNLQVLIEEAINRGELEITEMSLYFVKEEALRKFVNYLVEAGYTVNQEDSASCKTMITISW